MDVRMSSRDEVTDGSEINILRKICEGRNNLDHTIIERFLDKDIIYESQEKRYPIVGKKEVVDYLEERFEFLRSIPNIKELGKFRLATIDTPTKLERLCLAFQANAEIQALWLISVNKEFLVKRIDIITHYPDPKNAQLLQVQ